MDERGEIVPTDDFGRPLERNGGGALLPTNAYGHFVYARGPVARGAEIVSESGEQMPRNAHGEHTDWGGRRIRTDTEGNPIGWNGRALEKNARGQFVWRSVIFDL